MATLPALQAVLSATFAVRGARPVESRLSRRVARGKGALEADPSE